MDFKTSLSGINAIYCRWYEKNATTKTNSKLKVYLFVAYLLTETQVD